ncbi:fungal specific transcription factor domain-containing protein [Colletotrichum camelliae]|nr:fungal specific transcription factor domain-containing protein [Colletotrichum camelliae]
MDIIGTTRTLIRKIRPKNERRRGIAETKANYEFIDPPNGIPQRYPAQTIVKTTKYAEDRRVSTVYSVTCYPPIQMGKRWNQAKFRPAVDVVMVEDKVNPEINGKACYTCHKITIQHPALMEILGLILENEGFHLEGNDSIAFYPPFRPLASGLVNFDLAWTYFPNGTTVRSRDCDTEMVFKVAGTSYKKSESGIVLVIYGEALRFDGESFIWMVEELPVHEFSGNKPIRLLERGKKGLDLSVECCTYKGIAIADVDEVKHKPASPGWHMPPDEAAETPHVPRGGPQEESCISVSLLSPEDLRPPMSQPTFSPTFERIRAVEVLPSSTSSPVRTARAIAPESALSSSETFGSEIKTLLVSRSNPGSAASPSTNTGVTPLPHIDRRGLLEDIGPWPTEEEAHTMLDTVVFNVGISQQLFDVRAFSDNLSVLYQETSANVRLTEIWIVEALLVFAVGRLLQSKDDENGDLPGTRFFQEAVKRTPLLSDLRKHGIVGVEVMALTALYLQIVDRKDDAYLHSNTALRLAISHGMHRANSAPNLRRSDVVHRNRLWWSIYMQERRLCAAGGYPMSIEDYAIAIAPPHEVLGFPSATALAVNVKAARLTGKITSTIYSQKDDPENTFINNVQNILHSLYDVEKTMPSEYFMEIRPAGLLVAGRPFMDAPTTTSRTSSSLYISVYMAVIHTVRPILLYMARNSRDPDREDARNEVSPALVRLAEICVETASKTLVILQELRKKAILAKNAFHDLDATFSVGYIFVLVEAINPGKNLGFKGIDGSRSILRYLVGLGNRAAARTGQTPQQSLTDMLAKPFSFESGYGVVKQATASLNTVERPRSRSGDVGGTEACGEDDQQSFGFSGADLASIPLEGENSLYWVYHTPGFSFTGVEQTDWEALENQISWGNQP